MRLHLYRFPWAMRNHPDSDIILWTWYSKLKRHTRHEHSIHLSLLPDCGQFPGTTQAPGPLRFLSGELGVTNRICPNPNCDHGFPPGFSSGCDLRKTTVIDALPTNEMSVSWDSAIVLSFPRLFLLSAFWHRVSCWPQMHYVHVWTAGVLGLQLNDTIPTVTSYFSLLLSAYLLDFFKKISQI